MAKLEFEDLSLHIQQGVGSLYLICSSELVLVQQAVDKIKATFNSDDEKYYYKVDANTKFSDIKEKLSVNSLFSEKKFFCLNLGENNIAQKTTKELLPILQDLPQETTIVLYYLKLSKQIQQSKLFKEIDKIGNTISIWPVSSAQLPYFAQKKAQEFKLNISRDAINFLCSKTEGDLLALSQEIEKLSLIFQLNRVELQDIQRIIAQSTSYDVFTLADTFLQGNSQKAIDILSSLQENKTESSIILWAFVDVLKKLIKIKTACNNGTPEAQAIKGNGIWPKKAPLFSSALRRYNLNELENKLSFAAHIDRCIKEGKPYNFINLIVDNIDKKAQENNLI